jgi:hypothetical protein
MANSGGLHHGSLHCILTNVTIALGAGVLSAPFQTVPKIVPSGRWDALSCKLGQSAETRIFTSESQYIQAALKC